MRPCMSTVEMKAGELSTVLFWDENAFQTLSGTAETSPLTKTSAQRLPLGVSGKGSQGYGTWGCMVIATYF